jgi:hypothetical protein
VGRGVSEEVFAVRVGGGFGEDGAIGRGEEDAREGSVIEFAPEVDGEERKGQSGQEAEAHRE